MPPPGPVLAARGAVVPDAELAGKVDVAVVAVVDRAVGARAGGKVVDGNGMECWCALARRKSERDAGLED